jgi:hypothetical protein
MALNDIVFAIGNGGLGRLADGNDHWSGILFKGTKPTAFGAADIKAYSTIQDVETDLILPTGVTAVMHYHISQFFAQQPDTQLYVGVYATFSTNFQEINLIQRFAEGKLRQIALYTTDDFATSNVSAMQARADELSAEHTPLVVLYGANIPTCTLNALPDLHTLTAPRVAVVIGQDGNAKGKALFTSTTKSITCIGTTLGVLSKSNVQENIGWVEKYNLINDAELDVVAFAEGTLFKNLSKAQLDGLHDKGYLFLRKHIGNAGTFFNDSFTAVAVTSDFATLENNRTMDKAVRGMRLYLLPYINSPIKVNSNGKLEASAVKTMENSAKKMLEAMQRDNEISQFSVSIDPNQPVLTTSKIVVQVKIVPIGTNRNILVNIGFALKIN